MNAKGKCPRCHKELDLQVNMKTRVSGVRSFFRLFDKMNSKFSIGNGCNSDNVRSSLIVICPYCGNEFPFYGYKYFGLFGLSGLKILLTIFIGLFIVAAIIVLLRDTL